MIEVKLNDKALEIAIAKNNYSQNKLAELMGVSSGYLSQIVRHTRNASPRIRQKMQDILGLSFDELFIIEEGK